MKVKHIKPICQGNGRLCLARFLSNDQTTKFSISVAWEPRDIWVGMYWDAQPYDLFVYVCVVPLIPIRLHWKRSYSGRFA